MSIAAAATVIVARDAPGAPHILLVQRAKTMAFMANAYVFPGGRVDPADGEGDERFARAAARELAEEAGIVIPARDLHLVGHWLTPSAEPRRYDTKFFLAIAPAGQIARHDENETVAHLWASAADLLSRYESGALKLAPPQWQMLLELAALDDCAAMIAWAKNRDVRRIIPKLVVNETETIIYLPWDAAYAAQPGEGEAFTTAPGRRDVAGQIVLRQGRWWAK